MRWLAVAACVVLVGCNLPDRFANDARRICAENGTPPGSAGFDACFAHTFATIYPRAPGAAQVVARP